MTSDELQEPKNRKTKFFSSDGLKIRYWDEGKGIPILLLHPFTSGALGFWIESGYFDTFIDYGRAIAIDFRGHGGSDKSHKSHYYGMHMVMDIVNLLKHLQIEKAHLLGFSMGSEIALKFTVNYPDKVLSTILTGSSWSGKREGEVYQLTAKGLEEDGSFRALLEGISPPGNPKPDAQEIASFDEMILPGNDIKALAAVAKSGPEWFVKEEELAFIRSPIYGVVGELDPERVNFDSLQKMVPEFTFTVLEGLDHIGIFSDQAFIHNIIAFLSKSF